MTEAEWLTCTDTVTMLGFLRGRGSRRKRRLFACACCRLIWHRIPDGPCRELVRTAERLADGLATHADRQDDVRAAALWVGAHAAPVRAVGAVTYASYRDTSHANCVGAAENAAGADPTTRPVQAVVLRCIFHPFHAVAADPRWLTSTVLCLARTIYEDRAYDRLPILADALEDAACDEPALLEHCRSDGPHVRGCWAVDLVLGRE